MPTFVKTGDDTFKMVNDDPGDVRWIEPEQRPELPRDPTPTVGPNDRMRSDMVQQFSLSPEASDKLHKTPMHVAYGTSWPDSKSVSGWYDSGEKSIWLNMESPKGWANDQQAANSVHKNFFDLEIPNPGPVTAMHEFGHRWFDDLPMSKKWEWGRNWQSEPAAVELANQYDAGDERNRLDRQLGYRARMGAGPRTSEAYAQWAARPDTMTVGAAMRYYPGLYNVGE